MMFSAPFPHAATLSTTTLVLLVAAGALAVAALAEALPRLLAHRSAAIRGVQLGGSGIWRSARRIDGVLLDAWGTITTGELEVVDVDPFDPEHDRNLRWFAGALGHAYHDPVGRAIAKLAGRGHLSNTVALEGIGISGSVDRHPVRVGRPDWVGIEDTGGVGVRVGVEVDQRALGRITVAPAVRRDAGEAAQRLADMGIEPLLVTDLPSRDTDRLADAAGISQRWAETAPEKRGRLVCELQEHGRVVAMVGPCSGQADAHAEAALSVGDDPGSDIAMRDFDVSLVADALSLARRLPRVVMTNRLVALVTLLLTLPLALFTTLHWAVPATILTAGLVTVSLQSASVRAGVGVYPPVEEPDD